MQHFPGMGSGPGFSLSCRAFRPLDWRWVAQGSADFFLDIIVVSARDGPGTQEKAVSTTVEGLNAREK